MSRIKSRIVMEEFLGRKLTSREFVHHIDCNLYNTDISNLFYTDYKGHGKAHKSLNKIRRELSPYSDRMISIELFQKYLNKEGYLNNYRIKFDKDQGIYIIYKKDK